MIRTIRDMMLYHSGMFTNVNEKIVQARLLLEFVKDSLEGSNSPYSEVLRTEAALLAKQSDHYLRHDHLEEDNKQYYFREFMDEAKKHNLQYLSDSSVSTMYLGNMPAKVAEKLQGVNDIVRTEQYMDFITNRRFRSTLLCHDSVKLNRTINNDDIMKFNMTFNIVPEKPLSEVNITDSLESLKFFYNGNKDSSLSTSSSAMKAVLYSFSENINNPISFDKVTALANKKLNGNKLTEVKNELLNNAMKLVLQGYINITMQHGRDKVNLDKPKAAKLVSYQVSNTSNMWVTSLKHEVVGINLFEKIALQYMDGKNEKSKILESVLQHVNKGELVLSREGQKIENLDEINKELSDFLESTITKAAANALLVT
jgi:methyltransferase-like protein